MQKNIFMIIYLNKYRSFVSLSKKLAVTARYKQDNK